MFKTTKIFGYVILGLVLITGAISFGYHFKVKSIEAQTPCRTIGSNNCRRIIGGDYTAYSSSPTVNDPVTNSKNGRAIICEDDEYVGGIAYTKGNNMDGDDIWGYCCKWGG